MSGAKLGVSGVRDQLAVVGNGKKRREDENEKP